MIEIHPNIYHVKVPLMHSPLKELNCYMIRGDKRNLIIDTGFNQPEGEAILLSAIKELNFDLDHTDIFITHMHSDHSGLVCSLKTPKNQAYASKVDGALINALLTEQYWQDFDQRTILMGFPESEILDYTEHPAYMYRLKSHTEFTHIKEGDVISVGDYTFKVVDMAGHTPGQVGLYEETHKLCFCADHILAKISPNIIAWDLKNDHLGIFLTNLHKVKTMEIHHLFGGHRTVIPCHRTRIDELLAHHEVRLGEVIEALKSGSKNVYDTACFMKWDFAGGNFADFPVQQKWFAASEAFAHLQHLLFNGAVTCSEHDGILIYQLS